jgi:hypothetical protein
MFYSTDPTAQTASPPVPDDDRELQVLSIVHQAWSEASLPARPGDQAQAPERTDETAPVPHVSQRSIAGALGMSVGLTNAILKRLMEKGFVMMQRINHNNVHYLVTPAGFDQIAKRSYRYLRRTIGHVVRYKERLRAFCHGQKHAGIEEIVLIGESDLTFILEWCAEKEGLGFRVKPAGSAVPSGTEAGTQADRGSGAGSPPAHGGVLHLLSELHPGLGSRAGGPQGGAIPLLEIVLGNPQTPKR